MISFSCPRVDWRNNNTPIVSDAEMDVYAENLLKDYDKRYNKSILEEPTKLTIFTSLKTTLKRPLNTTISTMARVRNQSWARPLSTARS